jgi:hypothetical protein
MEMPDLKQIVRSLMRTYPSVFNPLWAAVYPVLFRRDELWAGTEYGERAEAFQVIHRENRWGSDESVTGVGSTLANTAPLRRDLARLLERLDIRVLLDAPCGDYNWMQNVKLPLGCVYTGADIVPELVFDLKERYSDHRHKFVLLDIVKDPLPWAELWLCRECQFHLSNTEIIETLENFARSEIQFILTTTFEFERQNRDIKSGGFRFINLRKPPFNLPKPKRRIADFVAPEPPRYLGLWTREQVQQALER